MRASPDEMTAMMEAGDASVRTDFSWKLWSLGWPGASPVEHTIMSRATNAGGNGRTRFSRR